MLLGLLAWGGTKIVSNSERLMTVEQKERSNKELLIYIRQKVDTINQKL
jgi:hypothetical protein